MTENKHTDEFQHGHGSAPTPTTAELSHAEPFDVAATIQVREPGEFIATIPAILGCTPANSLIVDVSDGPMLRVDLPGVAGHSGFSRHVTDVVSRHGRKVFLVVVGRHDEDATTSSHDLIDRLIGDLEGAGVETRGAWLVPAIAAGERWTCSAGDCDGLVPDPAATTAAATRAFRGLPTYKSISELRATLDHDQPEARERRARRIAELRAAGASPVGGYESIETTIEATSTGTSGVGDLDDDTLARIGYALTDRSILDRCLLDLVKDEDRVRSISLWTRLVQAMSDGPERSGPALLLAVAQYLSGDGLQANLALKIAAAADPTIYLTRLLQTAFEYGITPRELHTVLAGVAG
ncbi:conserved hypothetical protein [Alloactinosynnema sp. L-07]|uniref:DUF4192 domain-containing protein n=1 Tax=Alloactinosynnema sp. L-07 TaxID=1653480 RepID=UPI00065F06FA|nr:DUF4192 domain-containing protein [Alloactinosynnema sp. L-07]CRK57084.1 conserved hypothetical protein [Alloactinosynnema sp. L-07]